MIDISAIGSKITIKFRKGTTIEITEFSDEGSPFQCNDVDLSQNNKNMNGTMISSRVAQLFNCSVTVIPGSPEDKELRRRAMAAIVSPTNKTAISDLIVEYLSVEVPATYIDGEASTTTSHSVTFRNGRMKTGAVGPAASAQGRLGARSYSFEFQDVGTSASKVADPDNPASW